jgi:prophage regulatory protein
MATSLLRLQQVIARTGLSRSAIYSRIANRTFPAPVRISERARAWVDAEVEEWVMDKVQSGRKELPRQPQ